MPENLIKVIIFDLDNTLYDEKDFVKNGFLAVAEVIEERFKINKKDFFDDLNNIFKKDGRGHIFDIILQKYNIYDKNLINELVDVYHNNELKLRPYFGVVDLLSFLKKDYKVALLTDALGSVQRRKLNALGIKDFFDFVVYTDDYNKPKPDPFCFEKILKHFKVLPNQAVMVGDNPFKDFPGAKNMGIKTVRVLQGEYKNIKPPLNLPKPDYIIKNVRSIINILNKINKTNNV